jgi:hypothetical protein
MVNRTLSSRLCQKRWSKDLERAYGVPNCTGSAGYFWRQFVLTRPRLKRRSAQRSELQMSRSRFHLPNVPNQLTQHTKEESFRTSIPCPTAFAPDGGGRIFAKGVTLSGEKRA